MVGVFVGQDCTTLGSQTTLGGTNSMHSLRSTRKKRSTFRFFAAVLFAFLLAVPMMAQGEHHGGEANLILPDLNSATFLGGIGGSSLLMGGLVVCALGLAFG